MGRYFRTLGILALICFSTGVAGWFGSQYLYQLDADRIYARYLALSQCHYVEADVLGTAKLQSNCWRNTRGYARIGFNITSADDLVELSLAGVVAELRLNVPSVERIEQYAETIELGSEPPIRKKVRQRRI